MRFSFAKVPARKAICFFQRVWFTFAENSPFRWNHPFTMNSGFYHKALKSWDSPFRKICILREVPDLSHWTHLFTCFDCSEDGFLYHGTHLFKKLWLSAKKLLISWNLPSGQGFEPIYIFYCRYADFLQAALPPRPQTARHDRGASSAPSVVEYS